MIWSQKPLGENSLIREESADVPVSLQEHRISTEEDDNVEEDETVPRQVRLKRSDIREFITIDSLRFKTIVEPQVCTEDDL
jgi:hypothetical protein